MIILDCSHGGRARGVNDRVLGRYYIRASSSRSVYLVSKRERAFVLFNRRPYAAVSSVCPACRPSPSFRAGVKGSVSFENRNVLCSSFDRPDAAKVRGCSLRVHLSVVLCILIFFCRFIRPSLHCCYNEFD